MRADQLSQMHGIVDTRPNHTMNPPCTRAYRAKGFPSRGKGSKLVSIPQGGGKDARRALRNASRRARTAHICSHPARAHSNETNPNRASLARISVARLSARLDTSGL
jgi:hypothetical protein